MANFAKRAKAYRKYCSELNAPMKRCKSREARMYPCCAWLISLTSCTLRKGFMPYLFLSPIISAAVTLRGTQFGKWGAASGLETRKGRIYKSFWGETGGRGGFYDVSGPPFKGWNSQHKGPQLAMGVIRDVTNFVVIVYYEMVEMLSVVNKKLSTRTRYVQWRI